eukprot:scpid78042/ scgid0587/ 
MASRSTITRCSHCHQSQGRRSYPSSSACTCAASRRDTQQQQQHSRPRRSQSQSHAGHHTEHHRRPQYSAVRNPNSPGQAPTSPAGEHQDECDSAADPPQSPGERTWQRGSSYSVMPPDQRKREQILHTAQKEAESLRQYQAAQKERQGQFRSVTQRLGGDAGRHPDISAVRSAQQQKARVDVMTKSTRDQARREEYRKETQRQEDEKIQKHKEKQRLKARDMELREKERALMCQHSTRQHWESQHMQVYPYQDDQGQGGAQAASAPGRTTAGRSQFPSQHTKYRQHKEEKRKAEEEEYERHKASQRQKVSSIVSSPWLRSLQYYCDLYSTATMNHHECLLSL